MTDACPACACPDRATLATFTAPPEGENHFGVPDYRRSLLRCQGCGHVVNRHAYDLDAVYAGQYRQASYDGDGIRRRFQSILDLPPEKSDNAGRAMAVATYAEGRGLPQPATLLDVGSGMGVFPAVMVRCGWRVLALDPDPENVRCAGELAGAEAIAGRLQDIDPDRCFQVVSLNKVIEHVRDPAGMLTEAARHVEPGGFIYVEVPDADGALTIGPARQEFFLEHYHAFSGASLGLVARRAGLLLDRLERLREPSGKFTLRAFLSRQAR